MTIPDHTKGPLAALHRACADGTPIVGKPVKDKFKNADGTSTEYALACGYIDVATFPRGVRPIDAEVRVTLERHAGCRAYSVTSSGRYLRRNDYDGPSLKDARKAWRKASKTLARDEQEAREIYLKGAA